MSEQKIDSWSYMLICFLILFSGKVVIGDSLETDKQVLLKLKSYLENQTFANRGEYIRWNNNNNNSNPCEWSGISCSLIKGKKWRVVSVDISASEISGKMFQNFSQLSELTYLDVSLNTLSGEIPEDLSNCHKLVYLNLSHNILEGEMNLIGLKKLQTLDLSMNRIQGEIELNFVDNCDSLVTLNVSDNHFFGKIDKCFDKCLKLKYLDLSTNNLSGGIWNGISRLKQFSISENHLSGIVPSQAFLKNCSLEKLDISVNGFVGKPPKEVANCKNLKILNLSSNNFSEEIPHEIGSISGLQSLFLQNNSFSRDIPDTLLNLNNLFILDLSRNKFGGEVQEIFGKFKQLKILLLHANSYTKGLNTSGIFSLSNLTRLDLSFNNFSGQLPVEISQMTGLTFLTLGNNLFNGTIPFELGKLINLQGLDLGFNSFIGKIPPNFGNLNSLLWLMLADNSLTGEIPKELGNCSSLLWLNLANNKLTGKFPSELTKIGRNAMKTFESNRKNTYGVIAGNSECLSMKRWIPADYPPFSFVYSILTRKNCRTLWDRLLKGYGIFPMCTFDPSTKSSHKFGYVQLSGNQISGEIPSEIGSMMNFSMLHLGDNKFIGKFPLEISGLPLIVLNMTRNKFSGEIPSEIGNMKCMQNLDLSWNNFSVKSPSLEKRKNQGHDDSVKIFNLINNTIFTHADILKATGNFKEERIIGKGGFGTVYKGVFPDGREVAIKKLQREEGMEGEKEFRAEMKVLVSGQEFGWPHPNLVTLYGWCLYGSQRILVYEYIGGGNLEELVTDTTNFKYIRRLEVAIDVAKALVYLHHECYPPIVHRDVKASNVLLDKDGKAKVTDFGLARVFDVGDTHVSTIVAGTVGYVAPEYGQTWRATTKGDVYSFGVLIMELATGRRAVDGSEECLVECVSRKGLNYFGLVGDAKEMFELLQVGVKCTNDSPQERPNMKEVLAMLIKIYNSYTNLNYGHFV
ncbi:probable LRR receptor-like serine/threonine-protein kinase At1g74360 isoform X2 [Cicer arietinum]|uniref:probable LRR receptor-like serine/threonine-protein kinase At1g74360 isoform X2 n=1 Tax=Cicer arietinum TaxID=3827 RepID=UPI003CC5764B